MRFLCLHGMGTNADIFESQLAPLITRYDSEHTFDFVDAPYECSAAPGISVVYPPPYLAWHLEYEPSHIRAAHSFLQTIIDEDGPYDGVIGFSQGAALAASLLICDEYDGVKGSGRSPFKVAIFFNCVMLFSPSEYIGKRIGKEAEEWEGIHAAFHADSTVEVPALIKSKNLPLENTYGLPASFIPAKISLPTLQVVGTEDQFKEHSHEMVKLCQLRKARVLAFDAGHEVPRTKAFLQRFYEMFESVVIMAL